MAKSITVNVKRRGRPVTTGTGKIVGVRMLPEFLARLDHWAAGQTDRPPRPEAVRRLIELGLGRGGSAKASLKPRAQDNVKGREGRAEKQIDKAQARERPRSGRAKLKRALTEIPGALPGEKRKAPR